MSLLPRRRAKGKGKQRRRDTEGGFLFDWLSWLWSKGDTRTTTTATGEYSAVPTSPNHDAPNTTPSMAKSTNKMASLWQDLHAHRRTYFLTCVAAFGGMLFGWDTGLIGGVLTMSSFQNSFALDPDSPEYSNLSGNIVSVLQAGCFFGAMSSFYVSDTWGRKTALVVADLVFLVGSVVQTCSGLRGPEKGLVELYVGRVIGGFGVGLISAVVPTYIGECAEREIRGRCIGAMQLFK